MKTYKLIIKNNEDDVYWVENFSNEEDANKWIEEEQTRPYYLPGFTYTIEEITQVVHVPSYQEKRAVEYPSMNEYLDGVIKSNSEVYAVQDEGKKQVEKYIADCIAVKAKYPKPE